MLALTLVFGTGSVLGIRKNRVRVRVSRVRVSVRVSVSVRDKGRVRVRVSIRGVYGHSPYHSCSGQG